MFGKDTSPVVGLIVAPDGFSPVISNFVGSCPSPASGLPAGVLSSPCLWNVGSPDVFAPASGLAYLGSTSSAVFVPFSTVTDTSALSVD